LAFFLSLAATPQQRAIDYLSREVPRWSRENHCYSCHNNGDAARALYAAARLGYAVPKEALADTTAWLLAPARWDDNHGNPAASDRKLARIQFAAALTEAWRSGATRDSRALEDAAASLLPYQEPSGEWREDTGGLPGAPATYGTALATYMARRTLEATGAARFSEPAQRANRWLESAAPGNLVDAAALLLALPRSNAVRQKCLPLLTGSQTSDGGWGPQPHAPAEAFDTALVLLALDAAGERGPMVRGRALLLQMQESDGGWPGTTRPSGGQSYAERTSTAGWVAYALLLTDAKRQ
jgi:hypothetical protein